MCLPQRYENFEYLKNFEHFENFEYSENAVSSAKKLEIDEIDDKTNKPNENTFLMMAEETQQEEGDHEGKDKNPKREKRNAEVKERIRRSEVESDQKGGGCGDHVPDEKPTYVQETGRGKNQGKPLNSNPKRCSFSYSRSSVGRQHCQQ